MQHEVGDRLEVHGKHGTRIGVVVERDEEGGSRVRWADGGESALRVVTEAGETAAHETWNAANAAPAATWRRGVTAGVGHEASVAQEKLARDASDASAAATPVDEGDHSVDAGPTEDQTASGE